MDNTRYTSVAVALHWAIAILILGQIAGGLYMHNLPNASPVKFDLYQLHKSFGLSILVLTFLRLGWRLSHRPPALPIAMPGWQKVAARATHWGFYTLMLMTPLVGWAMVSVSPTDIPTKWFGALPVPHLPFFANIVDRGATEEVFKEVHEILAKTILVLLALHVAAALKHSLINKDGVLRSMIPSGAPQWAGIFVILGFLSSGVFLYFLAPTPQASAAATIEQSNEPANWIVDYEASRLAFIGSENGRSFDGSFTDFQVAINFDKDDLEGSSVKVVVGTGSAATGDMLRDSTIPEKEWFDVSEHPSATFTAGDIRTVGDNTYEAIGTLQIKDFDHPVTLAFALSTEGEQTIATGGADLVRTDFGLGLNDNWLNDEGVALEVRLEFAIHATRSP